MSTHPSALQAHLLRAAREDAPSKKARDRAIAAAALVALGGESCGVSKLKASASFWSWIVWLGAGLLGVVATGIAAHYTPPALSPSSPERDLPAFTVPPATTHFEGAAAEHLPPLPPPTIRTTPAPRPAIANPITAREDVEEESELILLRRAKRSLTSGNPVGAMALLDRRAQSYPRGILTEESDVLYIEALAAVASARAARARAGRFLAEHPTSPYAERVRTLMTTVREE